MKCIMSRAARAMLVSSLFVAVFIRSASTFAVETYPECKTFLTHVDPTSTSDRARLENIRNEYAELARQLRIVTGNTRRTIERMTRAAGENDLDLYKHQHSLWRRARLAVAAAPVAFQLPAFLRVLRWTLSRELSHGIEAYSTHDHDGLTTLREKLEDLEKGAKFFAEMAGRAEDLSAAAEERLEGREKLWNQ